MCFKQPMEAHLANLTLEHELLLSNMSPAIRSRAIDNYVSTETNNLGTI